MTRSRASIARVKLARSLPRLLALPALLLALGVALIAAATLLVTGPAGIALLAGGALLVIAGVATGVVLLSVRLMSRSLPSTSAGSAAGRCTC